MATSNLAQSEDILNYDTIRKIHPKIATDKSELHKIFKRAKYLPFATS